MTREIEPVYTIRQKAARLQRELDRARQELHEAEAELAHEQAEVNAFRMHARLKLDVLVDTLMELRAQKQAFLTRLKLFEQAQELGIPYDEDDPFWQAEVEYEKPEEDEDGLLLPTPTPRDKAAEKRLYRELARRFHPDLAKSSVERSYRTTIMAAINTAYAADDLQALYELAGELDPEEIADLAGIESPEVRRLREHILKCRQLARRARRQLQALRQENTARLWQRAQEIGDDGEDWWSSVRRELQVAIARREPEVEAMRLQLEELEQAHDAQHQTLEQ